MGFIVAKEDILAERKRIFLLVKHLVVWSLQLRKQPRAGTCRQVPAWLSILGTGALGGVCGDIPIGFIFYETWRWPRPW